jgi:hypothetical protein
LHRPVATNGQTEASPFYEVEHLGVMATTNAANEASIHGEQSPGEFIGPLARSEGLEPPASGFEARRSIQLS